MGQGGGLVVGLTLVVLMAGAAAVYCLFVSTEQSAELEREKADSERAEDRRGQIGSGDRSERIRTYNYPQGRVSDHRINLTLHKLDRIIAGDSLGEVIEALTTEDQAARLAELGE